MIALHAGHEAVDVAPAYAWTADPLVLGALGAAAVVYAAGRRRLRRRGRPDLAAPPRVAAFAGGLLLMGLALLSPLDELGERYLLTAHMVQHLVLGDLAPLLLVAGVMGPLALFVVPRPALRAAGRSPRARAALRALTRPATALAIWVAVTAGWHVPAAYELALAHRWAHDLEHATMLAAGLLVWVVILGAAPRTAMSPGRRAAFALAVFFAGMVVSLWLFLSGPLYDVYAEQPVRLLGLSPETDQMRAALVMSAEQMLTLLTAAALLLWTHVERMAEVRAPG